jgi:hypothetical protein
MSRHPGNGEAMARKRAESPLRRRRRRRRRRKKKKKKKKEKKKKKKKGYPEVLRGLHQANAEIQQQSGDKVSFSADQTIYNLNIQKREISNPMLADNRNSISLRLPRLRPLVLLIKSSITLKMSNRALVG